MKNNKIIFITILLFFINISSFGEEFNFKSTEINVLEKGNLIVADKGVKIETKDNLIIEGEKSEYNKKKQTLKILGNVKLYDKINNIIINSDNINYLKDKELIFSEGKTVAEIENSYFVDSIDLKFNRNSMEIYSKKKRQLKILRDIISVWMTLILI